MSNKESTMQILNTIGQRIRLHNLNCERHLNAKIPLRIAEVLQYIEVSNLDYFAAEHPQEIYNELKSSMYIPYACILIVINTECECVTRLLIQILHNIKHNQHLRYKTKFILTGYVRDQKYANMLLHLRFKQLTLQKDYQNRPQSEYLHLRPLNKGISIDFPYSENLAKTLYGSPLLKDHNIFTAANLDNTFFMQAFIERNTDLENEVRTMLYWLSRTPFISLKEFFVAPRGSFIVEHSPANADLYFYSINPALAIIINNYYFSNSLGLREGSEQDVRRLVRELKIAQIPFILIQDNNRKELLQILDYIQGKNFHPLKSFMFFIMTHGDAHNVIHTHDGELNLLEDVVKPIQSNKSLKSAQKVIIANACRGPIDMEYADRKDMNELKQFRATRPSEGLLHDNTVIWRSVPELVASPRHPTEGSPFMQSFCSNFRHIDHTQDIRLVHHRIEQDLENEAYYEALETRSDLQVGSELLKHRLIQLRINAHEMGNLIESIRDDFTAFHRIENSNQNQNKQEVEHQLQALFYICGSLKKIDVPSQISFEEKYFSTDLDKD